MASRRAARCFALPSGPVFLHFSITEPICLVSLGEAQLPGVRVSRGYALGSLAAADAVTVAPGEAPELVTGMRILHYAEGWSGEGRHEARVVGRR